MCPNITDTGETGVVLKNNIETVIVASGERRLECRLSSGLRRQLSCRVEKPPNRPARPPLSEPQADIGQVVVGDLVRFVELDQAQGQVVEVLPRGSQFSRRAAAPMPGSRPTGQVIAANADLVIPVLAAANPDPRWNLLDRGLVIAESQGLDALVCISKHDLLQGEDSSREDELESILAEYTRAGYPVVRTSSLTGEGLPELKAAIQGRLAVLTGKSGVGKTALLKALLPGLEALVGEVNRVTGKGRHTTSAAEMYKVECGGGIIDTPGVHEFGLWDIPAGTLGQCFPEIRPCLGKCRFGLSCRHDEEPGCAVRKAVLSGRMAPRRYQNLLKFQEEIE